MIYIHNSRLVAHGRLKSSNCLVDNRWTLKITDYGISKFLDNGDPIIMEENTVYKSKTKKIQTYLVCVKSEIYIAGMATCRTSSLPHSPKVAYFHCLKTSYMLNYIYSFFSNT